MFWLILFIVILILMIWYYKRCKKFYFDSALITLGAIGVGKTSFDVRVIYFDIIKAHHIWYRRTHIWNKSRLLTKLFRISDNEEEPFVYSSIPLYSNYKKKELFKFYKPLTNEIILREKRPNFKSIIFIDESSLVANSFSGIVNKSNPDAQSINEHLTLFLKLVRHELHGCYRNFFFRGYPNIVVNTQSKNDNHFAFDRAMTQALYITKSINILFLRLIWVRDVVLVDSIENNFEDDIKEDKSSRFFIMSRNIFNKYNSYAYSFLTDDLPIEDKKPIIIKNRFDIVTFLKYEELLIANKITQSLYENYLKESEVVEDGQ